MFTQLTGSVAVSGTVEADLPQVTHILDSDTDPAEGVVIAGMDGSGVVRAPNMDESGRLVVVPAVLPNWPIADQPPADAVMMVGASDGTDTRYLASDSAGQLKVLIENTPTVELAGGSIVIGGTVDTQDAVDGTPGAAVPALAAQVAGSDGTDLRTLLTDASGQLKVLLENSPTVDIGGTLPAFASPPTVDIGGTLPAFAATPTVKDVADGTPGSAAPSTAHQVAGTDGTDLRALSTDSSGQLKVLLENSPTVDIGGTLPAFAAVPTFYLGQVVGTWNSTAPGEAVLVGGQDPTFVLRALLVDSSGRAEVLVANSVVNTAIVSADPFDTYGTLGNAIPTYAELIGGSDGSNLRALATDTSGQLKVLVENSPTFNLGQVVAAPGAAVPSDAVQVAGSDGTDLRALSTDSSGQQHVVTAAGTQLSAAIGQGLTGTKVSTSSTSITALLSAPAAGKVSRIHSITPVSNGYTFFLTSTGTYPIGNVTNSNTPELLFGQVTTTGVWVQASASSAGSAYIFSDVITEPTVL